MQINSCLFDLCNLKVDHIFSSDLYRAKITAKYIKSNILFNNNIKYLKEFREINFWDLEWVSIYKIWEIQNNLFNLNWIFKKNIAFNNGESINDLYKRVEKWLQIIKKYDWNILLVTHSYVIRLIFIILNNNNYENSLFKKIKNNKIYQFNL